MRDVASLLLIVDVLALSFQNLDRTYSGSSQGGTAPQRSAYSGSDLGLLSQRSAYSGTGLMMPRPPTAVAAADGSDDSPGSARSRRSSLATAPVTSQMSQMSLSGGGSAVNLLRRSQPEGALRPTSRRTSMVEAKSEEIETKLPFIRRSGLVQGPS